MNRLLHTKSIIASAATAAVLIGGGATAATAMAATPSGGASGGASVRPAAAARTHGARTNAAASCQGIGFTVLHNDRSGGLVLPAGPYKVSSPDYSCKTASAYFTTFLNKYQGPIPGWTGTQLGYGYGTYTNNATKQYFTVKYVGSR
jgi:hypothetical protein